MAGVAVVEKRVNPKIGKTHPDGESTFAENPVLRNGIARFTTPGLGTIPVRRKPTRFASNSVRWL
jgi:hypothetical protein